VFVQHIVYDGDPLRDMGLTPFLDKFIQKKAKVGPGGAWGAWWLTGVLAGDCGALGSIAAAACCCMQPPLSCTHHLPPPHPVQAKARGSSLMQPLRRPGAAAGGDPGTEAFAALAAAEVAPADLFLHRFAKLQSSGWRLPCPALPCPALPSPAMHPHAIAVTTRQLVPSAHPSTP